MKKNMGSIDRLVRLMLASLFVSLYFTGVITGTLGLILVIFAAIFLLTSLIGFCPLYTVFGFKTSPKQK